jgi:putative redox protein
LIGEPERGLKAGHMTLISLAESGSRGTRADQGVRPTPDKCRILVLGKLNPISVKVIHIMASEMKIQLRQISASTSEATMGSHQTLIDRPLAKGGADLGPMGGELFLASVGGCFMSNLLAAIKAREAKINDVRTEVTGTIGDSPARFVALELSVSSGSPDRELLEKLVEIADRGCIMMNTLRGKLEVSVRLICSSTPAALY